MPSSPHISMEWQGLNRRLGSSRIGSIRVASEPRTGLLLALVGPCLLAIAIRLEVFAAHGLVAAVPEQALVAPLRSLLARVEELALRFRLELATLVLVPGTRIVVWFGGRGGVGGWHGSLGGLGLFWFLGRHGGERYGLWRSWILGKMRLVGDEVMIG